MPLDIFAASIEPANMAFVTLPAPIVVTSEPAPVVTSPVNAGKDAAPKIPVMFEAVPVVSWFKVGMSAARMVRKVGIASAPDAGPAKNVFVTWVASDAVVVPDEVIGLFDTVKMLGRERPAEVTVPEAPAVHERPLAPAVSTVPFTGALPGHLYEIPFIVVVAPTFNSFAYRLTNRAAGEPILETPTVGSTERPTLTLPVEVSALNVPALGVAPPIIVPLIVPPPIATLFEAN